jgi:tetratricopeptide (TPR) repeat protein
MLGNLLERQAGKPAADRMGLNRMPRRALAGLVLALAFTAPAFAARAPAGAPARGLPDDALAPMSVALQERGEAQLAQRQYQAAADSFEAALAADPRNRAAYVGLARAAEAEGLPGKAVRYYREALQIDPNHLATIEAQGLAYLARGARGRAEENLERLKKLCTGACPPADRLAAAIARPPIIAAPAAPTTTAAVAAPAAPPR